ncbi:glycosyltransferase family 2 protein [Candidatus Uhrbacteria bacterium]|nr:glycosyltransferase family 2 protein [Candidatus Uhrbacteria bacterium]
MLPKIAVQVISYHSVDASNDLTRLFESLTNVDYPRDRWHIVVIDNPSHTGRMDAWIDTHWRAHVGVELPSMEVISSPVNDGYAGGHVRGWEASLRFGASWVYLTNQDAVMSPDALQVVAARGESCSRIGLVQSLILLQQNPERVNSIGNCLHFLGFGFSNGNGKRLADVVRDTPHFYASGAGMLVRTEAVERAGGLFDPFYFMYHEDVDLAWRMRLCGYDVAVEERSIVFHRYEFHRSIEKFFWMERNRIVTLFTHLKIGTLVLIAPALFAMELGLLLYAIKGGWLKKRVSVYASLVRPSTRRFMRKRRRAIVALRKQTDRAMLQHMVGRIEVDDAPSLTLRAANVLLNRYFCVLKRLIFW